MDRVLGLAATALSRQDHDPSQIRVNVIGSGGVDAAGIAVRLARLLELPYAGVNPKTARSSHDLFLSIQEACARVPLKSGDGRADTLRLRPQGSDSRFLAPPMIVSIEEVYSGPRKLDHLLSYSGGPAKGVR